MKDAGEQSRASARRHGLPTPPPIMPSPPPAQLAYFRRYVRGLMDGSMERKPTEADIMSHEWRRLHPGIGDQESFRLHRLEQEWNADMAALLRRRAEWDIPPEVELDATPSAKTSGDEDA